MHDKLSPILEALRAMANDTAFRLRIEGDCMYPLLQSGAAVYVKGASLYLPGDCLVFAAADGRLTVHRLIGYYYKQRQFRYLTQADRAERPDCYILKQHIIGKVCGGECDPCLVIPPLGHRLRAVGRFCRFMQIRLYSKLRGIKH